MKCLLFLNLKRIFVSNSLSLVGCPLLLFWPLVCEARGSRGGHTFGEEGDDAVMEMRLRENPHEFTSALLQLSTRYLFVHGAQVCSEIMFIQSGLV